MYQLEEFVGLPADQHEETQGKFEKAVAKISDLIDKYQDKGVFFIKTLLSFGMGKALGLKPGDVDFFSEIIDRLQEIVEQGFARNADDTASVIEDIKAYFEAQQQA